MPSYKAREGIQLSPIELSELVQNHALKLYWFKQNGYLPHYWQTLFHVMTEGEKLCRFRHLVAGRRGGKTLSAAWELLYYLLHPRAFHKDAHNADSDTPLVAWVLTKDYPAGLPALMTFRQVLGEAALQHGVEYKENKGNRWFEFENGSWLFFKTADDPDSLRGAGLDILWMDEAAFIPNDEPWTVVRPALSDKLGLVLGTTTPSGKNWLYETFWNDEALADPRIGRVEYWSIDNPYFPAEEWEYVRSNMHPAIFRQEYCAAFDSMAGKDLSGDWLHYYSIQADPKDDGIVPLPRNQVGKLKPLKMFIGVDPAISLSDRADKFAMAALGIDEDNNAYLIEMFSDRIPFPEQVDMISLWHNKYRPQVIGIESVAYQAALAQQTMRLPGLPNIVALLRGSGKKSVHIMSMSPFFRSGRIRIRKDQRNFIDEWIDYDSELKNPKDDCLDAVELAIRCAGALLPGTGVDNNLDWLLEGMEADDLESARRRDMRSRRNRQPFDPTMGYDW